MTRKNDAFDAKIVNRRLTKIFIAIFAPDERLPSSATLCRCIICYFMQNVKGISQKLQPPWLKNLMIQSRISEIP